MNMSNKLNLFIALGLAFTLCTAQAHDGQDHAEPSAKAQMKADVTASPRFAATSELFELVGVLEGTQLSLYLDHAADNRPVDQAQLELEIDGAPLSVTRVAEGQFRATLAAPLPEGQTPLNATVTVGSESDLFAVSLENPDHDHDTDDGPKQAAPHTAARLGAIALTAALLLGLGWVLGRRTTHAKGVA